MNSINLNIRNGYWNLNEKPLKDCSIAKKNFFAQFVKMRLVKTGISKERTFKERANEIKQQYNHKFANLHEDSLKNHPNIEKLIFEPKK